MIVPESVHRGKGSCKERTDRHSSDANRVLCSESLDVILPQCLQNVYQTSLYLAKINGAGPLGSCAIVLRYNLVGDTLDVCQLPVLVSDLVLGYAGCITQLLALDRGAGGDFVC
jgi:hypothetical protein